MMTCRLAFSRKKVLIVILAVVLAIVCLDLFLLYNQRKPAFSMEPSDAEIKLLGIEPDGSGTIFDVNVKKIYENVMITSRFSPINKDKLNRIFIFEVPHSEGFTFLPMTTVRISGEKSSKFSTVLWPGRSTTSWHNMPSLRNSINETTSFVMTDIPKDVNQVWGFLKWRWMTKRKVDYVDISLKYFGPKIEADFTFKGPFTAGQTIEQGDKKKCTLIIPKENPYPTAFDASFKLSGDDDVETVFIYDKFGNRTKINSEHKSTIKDPNTGLMKMKTDINIRGITLDSIATITVGGKPEEIVYRNIPVHFSNYTADDSIEQLRERLNMTGKTDQQLWDFSFNNNFQDSVKAIDIVKSRYHIANCAQSLAFSSSKTFTEKLNESDRQRIRQAAIKWINSLDWEVRLCGYQLGLWTGYPEFLDLTLKQLNTKIPITGNLETDRYYIRKLSELSGFIGRYYGEISPEQWEKIRGTILDSNIPQLAYNIMQPFSSTTRRDAPEFERLYYDLAQDDRAYVWWQAIDYFVNHKQDKLEPFESLPEKIKIRAAMVGYFKADAESKAKAKEILPTLLTADLFIANRYAWFDFQRILMTQYDHKLATKVLIDFLIRFVNHPILDNPNEYGGEYSNAETAALVIRPINAWYRKNFGGFGTSEYVNIHVNTITELKTIINETIKWYEDNPQAEPLDLAFFKGQVVDSNSKPIPDAILTLRWNKTEWVTRDSGRVIEQKTEKYKTDSNGNFNISKFPNERFFNLEVDANGFVPKRNLYLQKQYDGSIKLSSGGADSNTIMLFKSQ
jgi:hypothetical protein